MSKILIGRGVTDSNGIATMTEDANGNSIQGYTGTGAGEVDFSAGCTIDGSSFQSETYATLDCIKYDNATQSNHNDTMWDSVSNINRSDEYSSFGSSSPIIHYTSITGDVCIEIDVMTDMGLTEQLLSIRTDSTSLRNLTLERLGMTTNNWKSVKLYIEDNTLTIDGITGVEYDVTGFTRLYIRSGTNYATYFKNLRIYPI